MKTNGKTKAKSNGKGEQLAGPPSPRGPQLTTREYYELSFNIPTRVVEDYNEVLGEMLEEFLPEPFKAAFWAYCLSDGDGESLGTGDMEQIVEGYAKLRRHLVQTGQIAVPVDFRLRGYDDPAPTLGKVIGE